MSLATVAASYVATGSGPALVSATSHQLRSSSSAWTPTSPALPTAAGQLFVVCWAVGQNSQASPGLSSLTKPGGETNTWTIVAGGNGGNNTTYSWSHWSLAYILSTVDWTGTTLTITNGTQASNTPKVLNLGVFSGCDGTVSGAASTAASASGTSISPTAGAATGDLLVCMPSSCLIGAGTVANPAYTSAPTGSADIGGAIATTGTNNVAIRSQYAIYDGANQTFTYTTTSGGALALAFRAA